MRTNSSGSPPGLLGNHEDEEEKAATGVQHQCIQAVFTGRLGARDCKGRLQRGRDPVRCAARIPAKLWKRTDQITEEHSCIVRFANLKSQCIYIVCYR